MREQKSPDIELLINCALKCGATVTTVEDGQGGVFINGEEFDVKDVLLNAFPDPNSFFD